MEVPNGFSRGSIQKECSDVQDSGLGVRFMLQIKIETHKATPLKRPMFLVGPLSFYAT